MERIDLNCDLGELPIEIDEQIMPFISSCNIACGGHTGNLESMDAAVKLAKRFGLAIGAHPSYPDKVNFGRKSIKIKLHDLKASIETQILNLQNICIKNNVELQYVKPHGALYNDMSKKESIADLLIKIVKNLDSNLKFMGATGTIAQKIAKTEKLTFINEVFADRRYENLKELRNRKYADALLENKKEILNQVEGFLNGVLIDRTGQKHQVVAQSICLHSDTPGAIHLAQSIHEFIIKKNVQISAY